MSMNDHYITREGVLRTGELSAFQEAIRLATRRVADVFEQFREAMDDEVTARVRERSKEVVDACDRRMKRLDYCERNLVTIVEWMMTSGRFTLEDVGLIAELADALASDGFIRV